MALLSLLRLIDTVLKQVVPWALVESRPAMKWETPQCENSVYKALHAIVSRNHTDDTTYNAFSLC